MSCWAHWRREEVGNWGATGWEKKEHEHETMQDKTWKRGKEKQHSWLQTLFEGRRGRHLERQEQSLMNSLPATWSFQVTIKFFECKTGISRRFQGKWVSRTRLLTPKQTSGQSIKIYLLFVKRETLNSQCISLAFIFFAGSEWEKQVFLMWAKTQERAELRCKHGKKREGKELP